MWQRIPEPCYLFIHGVAGALQCVAFVCALRPDDGIFIRWQACRASRKQGDRMLSGKKVAENVARHIFIAKINAGLFP
jgi:hypothetical protein